MRVLSHQRLRNTLAVAFALLLLAAMPWAVVCESARTPQICATLVCPSATLEPGGQAQTAAFVAEPPRPQPPDPQEIIPAEKPAVAHQPILADRIAAASIHAFAAPSFRFFLSVVHRI